MEFLIGAYTIALGGLLAYLLHLLRERRRLLRALSRWGESNPG